MFSRSKIGSLLGYIIISLNGTDFLMCKSVCSFRSRVHKTFTKPGTRFGRTTNPHTCAPIVFPLSRLVFELFYYRRPVKHFHQRVFGVRDSHFQYSFLFDIHLCAEKNVYNKYIRVILSAYSGTGGATEGTFRVPFPRASRPPRGTVAF